MEKPIITFKFLLLFSSTSGYSYYKGGEGTVVFDSAIATLQGMFPPNPHNKMTLANDTTVIAPLGGYQYVPGQFNIPLNSSSI